MSADLRRFGRALALGMAMLMLAACARTSAVEAGHRGVFSDSSDDPPGRIEFEGRNLFRKVGHTFEAWKFTRVVVEDGGEAGAGLSGEIEAELETASVETGNAWLNEKARSPEFLDVERYPKARLWIGNIRPATREGVGGIQGTGGGEVEGGGEGGGSSGRFYLGDARVELRGVEWRGPLEFELVSRSPLVVAGEVELDRSVFGIGPPYRWYNPFSIRNAIPVRFEVRIPED